MIIDAANKTIKEIKWDLSAMVEFIRFRDWTLLKYLILKDIFKLLNLKNKHQIYFNKYFNDTSTAYIKDYNLKVIHRRYDSLKEILIEKQYFDVAYFIPVESQIVLDIGANIGEYSLIASRLVGNLGKVFAIEPNTNSFNILERNIELNNIKNIISINMAVTDSTNDKITLYEMDTPTVTTMLIIEGKQNSKNSYMVKTIKIDDLIRSTNINRLDLLKIDVEGAEVLVLNGALEAIAKYKPNIIIEVHLKNNREKIIGILCRRFGYKVNYERITDNFVDTRGLFDYLSLMYLSNKKVKNENPHDNF